jgi:DNA repair protein RadC
LKNANAVILAHNHPSGCLEPSQEDITIFQKLQEIGRIIQLAVLDSIIFNEREFYSLLNH